MMISSLAGTATGRLFAAYLPSKLIEEFMLEDHRRLGPDIANPLTPESVQSLLMETRKFGLSRALNNPTPGICSFAAPVFDYSGNIVLGLTLLGRSGSFEFSWDGPQALAAKNCAAEVSKRLGHTSSMPGRALSN